MYLLRYLTFNQLTQSIYPKMYITIFQNLAAKGHTIKMFDSAEDEILQFSKDEKTSSDIDKIYNKLVLQDTNFPLLMKIRPKLICPKIQLSGIILESPQRKVQLKSLAEFGSLTDGNVQTITIGEASKEFKNFTTVESRDTLRVDCSNTNSQYVAISVKNHELRND